jgi:hypothetical protein
MNPRESREFLGMLADLAHDGYTLVTWDGMRRLWNGLAWASGDRVLCRQLASAHVDMMFHLVCVRGHRLSLSRAAEEMGLSTVPTDRRNELWQSGQWFTLLEHVAQDAQTTLKLAERCQLLGKMLWRAGSGQIASLSLPEGWLCVNDALRLPTPDVAGLYRPASRRALTAWMY